MAPCRRPEFRQFLTPPFLTPHRGAATIDTLAAKAAHPDRACPERSQSPRRLAWPRTSPFHGGNTGSNPVGDAKHSKELSRFHSGWLGFKKVQFCWNAIIHSRSPCYRLEGSTRSRTEIRSFR